MTTMARQCEFCGRGAHKIFSRSKSNIKTIRRQQVNLQWKRIQGVAVRICTSCIKTLKHTATSKKVVA